MEIIDESRFYQAGGVFNKKSKAIINLNKDLFEELGIKRLEDA